MNLTFVKYMKPGPVIIYERSVLSYRGLVYQYMEVLYDTGHTNTRSIKFSDYPTHNMELS